MNMKTIRYSIFCLVFMSLYSASVSAGSLNATVSENGQGNLENAVVYAIPTEGLSSAVTSSGNTKTIDQIDKEFVPSIAVFQTGVTVQFPNHDNVRHHVYSFSPAKTFEIPLYKGIPAEPVKFDEAGVITLGCNIHDWMTAHILITDTPYFGLSDSSGNVELTGLPNGAYDVYVWHPQQSEATEDTAQQVVLNGTDTQSLSFDVQKKEQWVPFRAPTRAAGSYR